jgi:hypothetical protein
MMLVKAQKIKLGIKEKGRCLVAIGRRLVLCRGGGNLDAAAAIREKPVLADKPDVRDSFRAGLGDMGGC